MNNDDEKEVIASEELKISPGTIARTIILGVAIVNKILAYFGKPIINLDSALLSEFVSDAWLIISAITAWWKNNSFTLPALAGDVIMRALRAGRMSLDDEENEEDGFNE